MLLKNYTLPSWSMVAGENKEQRITLRHQDGSLYDLGSATVEMTVRDFVNRNAAPVLALEQQIVENDDGMSCILVLSVSSSDTEVLHGKYLYQAKISDAVGNVAKLRGIMTVYDDQKYI